MPLKRLVLASGALALVGGAALGFAWGIFTTKLKQKTAPHLTRAGLLKVRAGMAAHEVPKKIGYPLSVRISGPTAIHPLDRVDGSWPGPYVWVYADPGLFGLLEVNVIVSDGVVSSVNVESDDVRVYSTSGPPAPIARPLAEILE